MWRTYVILVLIGLLLVSTGGDVLLLRQMVSSQAEMDRLRARARNAEDQAAGLQSRVNELAAAPTPASGAATPASGAGTPASGAAAAPTPGVAAPTVTPGSAASTAGPDRALLQRIEDQVSRLRGLRPKAEVPLRFLDHDALQHYFIQNFNKDYLPAERESDQKLLATLGLVNQNDNVVQILQDLLVEQVIGVYNEDEKVMYIVGDTGQFGPDERDTFAHEFTHALQDQYFDLNRLSPKHPDNDDRALAIQALVEGDAVLIQRLWAQQNLSADEQAQLGQGGSDSKLFSTPAFIRQQLLFPYGDGFNFVRQMYQTNGGSTGVDDVFRNPPESTEQVLHPDKYRAHEKPVEVSLPDLPHALGAGWRQLHSSVFGELDLRLLLEQYTDPTRAARGAAGWGGDRWVLLEKDGRQAVVLKTVWDTDNDARKFFDTYALALRNRFTTAKQEESSASRQALTATTAATELRRDGQSVLAVISFDRPSAEAIVAAVSPSS